MHDTDCTLTGRQAFEDQSKRQGSRDWEQQSLPVRKCLVIADLTVRQQPVLAALDSEPEKGDQHTCHQAGDRAEKRNS